MGVLLVQSHPLPLTPIIEEPYKVTALLNDSTWFGSAYTSKTLATAGSSTCTSNRLDIGFSTDIPYGNTRSRRPFTGCSGNCIPTQTLGFRNIPMAKGKYEIATLNTCAGQDGAVNYYWLVGGDGIVNSFGPQQASTGWIEVTGYNMDQHAIEGTFDIDLSNQSAQMAHFKKGTFKALIK